MPLNNLLHKLPKTYKDLGITSSLPSIIFRILIGLCTGLLFFNTAYYWYFEIHPLFGVYFLGEGFLGLCGFALGFHTFFIIFVKIKQWIEKVLIETVYKIVSDFWNLQSKKMAQARKQRENKLKLQMSKGLLLDTSVLIDGRFLELIKLDFIDNPIIIPQIVLDELHLLADNEDKLKRQKGRKGLDLVVQLKKFSKVSILKHESQNKGADIDLIDLAKKYKFKLVTLDFNLNKHAKAQSIKVLNINELANSVKTPLIPGETLKIKIVQAGKEKNQGLSYLPDGTMIVVEEAKTLVGQDLNVVISKIIQTSAGKMLFAEIA